MIILSWNVIGLAQPLASFFCNQMIHRVKTNFCFLMDTKVNIEKWKQKARNWGFQYCEGTTCMGLSGGLMILWDESVKVSIKFMNKNIINAYISDHHNNFWISCLYGHLEMQFR